MCSRFRAFSLSFRFLSSASVPVPATQLSVSSFPLSSRFRLSAASPVLPLRLSASLLFPVLSDLVSRVFFPGSSYSALCLFPFIPPGLAPTAVPPVLPFRFRLRAFPSLSAFFRPLLLGSDYSAFRSFFSLLPVLPCRRFLRCCLSSFRLPCSSSSLRPVSMPSFRFRYSAFCTSFLRSLSRLTVATPAPQPSPFGSGLFPFAFALGSGYLA